MNERFKIIDYHNLELLNYIQLTNDGYDMPIIKPVDYTPKDLIGFNYAKTYKDKNVGIHFYLDDYQFERLWNNPLKYVDTLREYDCILSPDYSTYTDMSYASKVWSVYKSKLIGAFYQYMGLTVIPTVQFCEKDSYKYAFSGMPKHSTVSVSNIGVMGNKEAFKMWNEGVDALLQELEPKRILLYGHKIERDYGNAEIVHYKNKNIQKFTEMKKRLKWAEEAAGRQN